MMLLSLVQLLFWVGVALLLIWLTYRALRPRGEREPALHAVRGRFVSLGAEGPSALEILRRRFAAG
jgi:membrane protein implicated in regulation of membrane protease activity